MAAQVRSRLVLAAAFLLASLVIACGGSGGTKATSTPSIYPTAIPTAAAGVAAAVASPTRTIAETVFDAPPPSGISTLTFIDPLHGWAIDSCPENKSNQFVNIWCAIMSTDDGGVTWRRQYREIHKIGTLQFLDVQHGFVMGGGSGVLATNDGGATWSGVGANAPHDLSGIRFITPDAGYAVASGVIFQLNADKNAWVFTYGTPDCSFSSISSSPTGDVWAGGRGSDGPCLYKTSNERQSWTPVFSGVTSPALSKAIRPAREFGDPAAARGNCTLGAPDFFNDSEAHVSLNCQMGASITLSTTDGGKTWQYASEQYSCLMGCMTNNYQSGGGGPTFYLDNMHAWQRTGHQVVSWSVDGGLTWTNVDSPALCCDAGSIFFVDAEHGWVTVGGEIARTTDGGSTWARLPVVIQ